MHALRPLNPIEPHKILLLEPFLGGSHAQWAHGLQRHSQHQIKILGLPARHWKWRMHGAGVTLAREFMELDFRPELILATDMLDLTTFLALTRKKSKNLTVAIYFHENQIAYPWSPTDQDVLLNRDNHYGYINYTSALTADRVFFNSEYNLNSFLDGLRTMLKRFPDRREMKSIEQIRVKSKVLPLGMELPVALHKKNTKVPILLWNHRWEYDKGPEVFFQTLIELKNESWEFNLVVLGESYGKAPAIFSQAKEKLAGRILHWGFTEDKETYLKWLQKADILPVTSRQDFFGGSVVEAMASGCLPLLPDRLAYPMHIPTEFHKDLLYPEGQFKNALQKILSNPNRKGFQVEKWVAQYNWKTLIMEYDRNFSSLVKETGK